MRVINIQFTIRLTDEKYDEICQNTIPCEDILLNIAATALRAFPIEILALSATKQILEEVLCPECNKRMVSRKGQYGTFWGCSDYPKCKGTRDSMGRSKADREREKDEERPPKRWNVT